MGDDRAAGGDRPVRVIGMQMADARVAEERHRATAGDVPSPLAEVAYDGLSRAAGLGEFVESPTDERLREFVSSFTALDSAGAGEVRAALRQDDLYTLISFARRRVLASVRDDSAEDLRTGLTALTALDQERVDWRDVTFGAALLSWAMLRAGVDAKAEFTEATRRAEPGVERTLRRFAEDPVTDLVPWGQRLVTTSRGPMLVDDARHPFDPAIDLVDLALTIERVIDADSYRVSSLAVASELPAVWLQNSDTQAVQTALEKTRGCVLMRGELEPSATPNAANQMLLAAVLEAISESDARALASAATSTDWYEAIGVADGRACCVLVARSFVKGIPAFEGPGALRRFAPALAAALRPAS